MGITHGHCMDTSTRERSKISLYFNFESETFIENLQGFATSACYGETVKFLEIKLTRNEKKNSPENLQNQLPQTFRYLNDLDFA